MKKNRGAVYLVLLLIMSGVFIMLATAIMGLAFANLRLARHNEAMVSSLQVAEAGANYYLWHLLHDPKDFCDNHTGQECVLNDDGYYGPYEHELKDTGDNVLGTYKISIKPPSTTQTLTIVKSLGQAKNSTLSRTVIADIGIPSFAAYALLSDAPIWFGQDEITNGPVHSNVGIRYDPLETNGIISASRSTYVPSTEFGGDGIQTRKGVWRPDNTTGTNWQYPKPVVDFTAISIALNQIQAKANDGIALEKSTGIGYHLKLKEDNTIDISTVRDETIIGISEDPPTNRDAPNNGLIYVNDRIWVDGVWDDQITIATPIRTGFQSSGIYDEGRVPAVIINGNLKYKEPRDTETKKIGIVATGDIAVPHYNSIPEELEIDASLVSQEGHVWSPKPNQLIANQLLNYKVRNKITIYGSISSYLYWNWTYVTSSNVVVNGAGDISYNGIYAPYMNNCNGKRQYIIQNSSHDRYLFQTQDMSGNWIWRLHTACQSNSKPANDSAYYGNDNADPHLTNPWNTGSDGVAPAPTISDTYDGFKYTEQIYDPSLRKSQPPYFPTSDSYQILSWREE